MFYVYTFARQQYKFDIGTLQNLELFTIAQMKSSLIT